MKNKLKIEWYKDCRVAVGMVSDPYNPNVGWLSTTMIGLRSDGVVVWKEIKNPKPDAAADTEGEK